MWPDGAEYSGAFNGPLLEGQGTMKLDNEVITGQWRDSKLEGKGERRMANGDRYVGFWVKGKLQGYGEHSTAEETYQGMYFNNREQGKGKKTREGYVYEGYFKEGMFEGQGKQMFNNGDYYIGGFHEGQRQGKGTFKFANGDEYEGEWMNNEQNGFGTLKSKYQSEEGAPPVLSTYTGSFQDGLFHGSGTFSVQDGFTY